MERLAPAEYEVWAGAFRSAPIKISENTVLDVELPSTPLSNRKRERIAGRRKPAWFRLPLDENGVGYFPAALAGSTLSFQWADYRPTIVENWNGRSLELQLDLQANQLN